MNFDFFFDIHITIVDILTFFLSLGVAIWSYFINKKLNKQQEIINKYQIDSYSKANLVLKVENTEGGHRKIIMTNIGNSPAKNVRIDWNGLGEDGKIVINEQRKLPYAILGSGESLFVTIVLYGTDKRNPIIFLLWEDDYSKNNRKETSISF
ncbi:hypothetical protein [uncultured Capnocytophaga sp.]|uniref:hypothetical protein n=1 Tax=uncultured Capnocytophaga sp. TaxID=159273 RepID=UPI0026329CCF|nr:hypothetical protein [uncultured Capnocytophaga sp.]